jgi:hypothetical protein
MVLVLGYSEVVIGVKEVYEEESYSPHIRYIATAESTSVERQILFVC